MAQPQSKLLSGLGTWFEIDRKLVEQVINQGGDDSNVKRILAEPEVVVKIARLLVGRVWDYVDALVVLDVDWKTPDHKLHERYARLNIADDMRALTRNSVVFQETNPEGPCQYTLRHFPKTLSRDEAIAALDGQIAGYRELLAYGASIDTGPCYIVGLGSQGTEIAPSFPRFPCLLRRAVGISIVAWTAELEFDPTWFFLVRVYK